MIQIPIMQNQIPERFQISGRTDKITSLFPEGKLARNVMNGVYFIIGLQGETIVEIDGKTYTIRKGTFICLTPNHLLLMLFRSDDFLFEYLSFEFDFLSDFPLLLKSTEMSITEIADELKFPNSSFFARFFHKYTGMSPMQYRKNVC